MDLTPYKRPGTLAGRKGEATTRRIITSITPEQREWLEARGQATERPVAAVIRDLIDAARQDQPLPKAPPPMRETVSILRQALDPRDMTALILQLHVKLGNLNERLDDDAEAPAERMRLAKLREIVAFALMALDAQPT